MSDFILINEVDFVNFVVKLENYTTYEFETKKAIYVDEAEDYFHLFRLIIKQDDQMYIYVANESDYDISEEVSYLFDMDAIKAICESKDNLSDETESYLEHYSD